MYRPVQSVHVQYSPPNDEEKVSYFTRQFRGKVKIGTVIGNKGAAGRGDEESVSFHQHTCSFVARPYDVTNDVDTMAVCGGLCVGVQAKTS